MHILCNRDCSRTQTKEKSQQEQWKLRQFACKVKDSKPWGRIHPFSAREITENKENWKLSFGEQQIITSMKSGNRPSEVLGYYILTGEARMLKPYIWLEESLQEHWILFSMCLSHRGIVNSTMNSSKIAILKINHSAVFIVSKIGQYITKKDCKKKKKTWTKQQFRLQKTQHTDTHTKVSRSHCSQK